VTDAAAQPVPKRRLYRLSPIDRTGVFLGLGIGQLAVSGTGALLGAVLMVFVAVLVGGLGLVRVRGESLLAQLPLAFVSVTSGRTHRDWFSAHPLLGEGNEKVKVPAIAAQELGSVDPTDFGADMRGPVGLVVDRRAQLYAITVRISGRQFGLLEPADQDYQLAGWGNVLAGFVRERPTVASIRWTEWASPSGIEEQRDWLESHKAAQPIADAVAAYERLLAEAGPIATRHEVLLTISTHPSKCRLEKRHEGDRERACVEALLQETRVLLQRLAHAGLTARVLDAPETARAVRLRLDPSVRATLDRRQRATHQQTDPSNFAPMATRQSWSTWTVDASRHRCFEVKEWPRLDVPGDWMRDLLLYSAYVRAITVFLVPVPRSKSQRAITSQATKIEADVAHRTEKGFRVGAWHRRAAKAVNEREEELVAGHVELTYGGLVTVTAATDDELDKACGDITQVAAAAGIELRACYGRHDAATLASLPLARGVVARA
jgi:Putative type VII ESX secretion system translocon, EccE